jgi:phosphate transport system substrate-binding protein
VQNVPSGLFSYGGSTAWERLRRAIEPELQAARREFRLRYVNYSATDTPSSTTGINSLLNGQFAFSLASRSIKTEEFQEAQQRSLTLTQIPVAIDGLAFVVHPDLNIPGLTLDQLKGIYLGKLTNWQQVGGPNLPIVALSHDPKAGGIVDQFIETVLGGQPLTSSVQLFKTAMNAVRKVSQTPGAIYVDAAPEVIAQCNIKPIAIGRSRDKLIPPYEGELVTQCPEQRNRLNQAVFQSGEYPLTHNLLVIVKQNKGIEQQAGEAYANLLLTQAGQAIVAKAGFVPIR